MFIGPPIFFTGPPTFSSVEDRGLTSFAESVTVMQIIFVVEHMTQKSWSSWVQLIGNGLIPYWNKAHCLAPLHEATLSIRIPWTICNWQLKIHCNPLSKVRWDQWPPMAIPRLWKNWKFSFKSDKYFHKCWNIWPNNLSYDQYTPNWTTIKTPPAILIKTTIL